VLYIIPTPIGNLKDITYRAVETLGQCQYILCEDTRRSQILLSHYNIHKPLKSFHLFNEAKMLGSVIADIQNGADIALISDGGTPGICDPGGALIEACKTQGISYSALPGPCAAITAASMWGRLDAFQFLGFFPRKEKEAHIFLYKALHYDGVTLFYESPQRIEDTLLLFAKACKEKKLLIVRELTKAFEEILYLSPEDALAHFKNKPAKGEFVIAFEGRAQSELTHLSPEALLDFLITTFHLPKIEAIKAAASLLGLPKQSLYKLAHQSEDF
jgi:16S rRNA (cytidine1402-2'-O)-methyltransferase